MEFTEPLVSVDWLHSHLHNPDLLILDASLPKPKTNAADNPLSNLQIPNARFFDINSDFSDQATELPHMMPSPSYFEQAAQKLGINNNSTIVVYDNIGVYSSPRARWMLKSMGHKQVLLLDGGLPEWVKKFPTEAKKKRPYGSGDFIAAFDEGYFRNAQEVLKATEQKETTILDARSDGRFTGTAPEPRTGLRGGHIPKSKNIPFTEMLTESKMKSSLELKAIFEQKKVKNHELIFSCGSGLTACIIALGAEIVGYDKISVYDGSWSEWGMPGELPVVTA